jgi:hypothetical protein
MDRGSPVPEPRPEGADRSFASREPPPHAALLLPAASVGAAAAAGAPPSGFAHASGAATPPPAAAGAAAAGLPAAGVGAAAVAAARAEGAAALLAPLLELLPRVEPASEGEMAEARNYNYIRNQVRPVQLLCCLFKLKLLSLSLSGGGDVWLGEGGRTTPTPLPRGMSVTLRGSRTHASSRAAGHSVACRTSRLGPALCRVLLNRSTVKQGCHSSFCVPIYAGPGAGGAPGRGPPRDGPRLRAARAHA